MVIPQATTEMGEAERVKVLHATGLLETGPSAALDQITRLASQIFGTPISLITLVDAHRQWLKSRVGMEDIQETRREDAFCTWTIAQDGVLVVEDATCDPRFADNAMVVGSPHIVFYAGAPLVLSTGHALGSLCIIDTKPRSFSEQEREQLAILASLAMGQLELHHSAGRVHEVTRLPNRAQLMQDMQEQAIDGNAQTHGDRKAHGLMLIDLLGQLRLQAAVRAVGIGPLELILREIAAKLRAIVGKGWPIYHVAETRFCIPLRDKDHAGQEQFSRLVMAQLGAPFQCAGVTVELAPRAGLVAFGPGIESGADALRKASSAVQEAAARGKEYLWHDERFDAANRRAYHLLQELPDALARGDLRLVYQPKLNLRQRAFTGVEALVRWRHAGLGTIPPSEFIPLIEGTPLIHTFTRWVLDTAMGQLARWRTQGIDVTMALNISSRNLDEQGFVDHVRQVCERHGVPPNRLHVECTETAVMTKQETRDALLALQEMGAQISLDDFGMGYSNLACLRELPVKLLKLDQSLIKPVDTNTRALQLVKSLVLMGHSLGYRMLAEGVETQAVYDLVVEAGCDAIQGYFLSQPLEAEDVPAFLARHATPAEGLFKT